MSLVLATAIGLFNMIAYVGFVSLGAFADMVEGEVGQLA